jgi:pantetheine-phosphate adenylyltransferase
MRIGIYPGSFDPITYGHIDIIKRALKVVDVLIVSVLHNKEKKAMFSSSERVELIRQALDESIEERRDRERVLIETFDGLLVDYAKKKRANIVIRGIRNSKDFEYEATYARVNKELNEDLETICLITDKEYMDISSSMVREISSFNGDVSKYVPLSVMEYLEDIK